MARQVETNVQRVVSFDIDGTLETGGPPGAVAVAAHGDLPTVTCPTHSFAHGSW